MTETVNGIAFALLALATVGGAAAMLWSRNVIHAAFWLLEVSIAASGLYLLLEADYVAMVQLLVYAGAVAVLTIFTVMLTLRRREDAVRPRDLSWLGAAMAALFLGMVAVAIAAYEPAAVEFPQAGPGIVDFGKQLFSVDGWALPFEIASLVLTAALVGAVWWSKDGDE